MQHTPLELFSAVILLVWAVSAIAHLVAAKTKKHGAAVVFAQAASATALALSVLNAYAVIVGALVVLHLALLVVTTVVAFLYWRSVQYHRYLS